VIKEEDFYEVCIQGFAHTVKRKFLKSKIFFKEMNRLLLFREDA